MHFWQYIFSINVLMIAILFESAAVQYVCIQRMSVGYSAHLSDIYKWLNENVDVSLRVWHILVVL